MDTAIAGRLTGISYKAIPLPINEARHCIYWDINKGSLYIKRGVISRRKTDVIL